MSQIKVIYLHMSYNNVFAVKLTFVTSTIVMIFEVPNSVLYQACDIIHIVIIMPYN